MKSLNIAFAIPSKIQTTGFKIKIKNIIGRTMRTATASGWVIAMRLGIRSAIRMKLPVTSANVSSDAAVLPQLPAFCQQTAEIRAHRRFADDTGENGDGVQTDLYDG